MNTLFALHDEPAPPVDRRTPAERQSQLEQLVSELRRAEDGISYKRCIEVAGELWLADLKAAGVRVDFESTGIVRIK